MNDFVQVPMRIIDLGFAKAYPCQLMFPVHQLLFSQIEQLRKASKFEDEIRMEQEERKREEEEKAARRAQFRQKAALFGN